MSASDGIRMKWAYYLGLLSVAAHKKTNHPGVVVFDEPDQQEIEPESFASFLRRSADLGSGQQVIIATSESLSTVAKTIGIDGNIVNFNGLMLKPVS